jgi:hypothetical protein
MIRDHAFNSAWWGAPCGIVDDLALFARPAAEIRAVLAPWAWVELRADHDDLPSPAALAAAGFFHADTQIHFKLALPRIAATASTDRLTVRFADESTGPPLTVDAAGMAVFRHERFRHLPGADDARINARYARWTAQLVADHPATCLAVLDGPPDHPASVQGWFLSRPATTGLGLTLAMLRAGARISGHHLYHKAALAYAARGHRIGAASFSATNTAVLNVYASLGARFIGSEHFWLWVRG